MGRYSNFKKTFDNVLLRLINMLSWGLPRWLGGKEPSCQCRRCRSYRFDLWVGKPPLEEEMATHPSILALEIPWAEEPRGHSP